MRPLGIPAFADKLVQEVVRQILEAIYEQFSAIIRTVFGLIEAVTPHCIKLKAPVGEPTG